MSLRSLFLVAVGSVCVAVGLATVAAPNRVRDASQSVFPDTSDDPRVWRGIGLLTAGVGCLLVSTALAAP